jgi:proton-dependent oligopeptide transporter, POT family
MSQPASKTLFGHPIGLFVLFFTEMWERFSYYGMRVLLVLYMTKELIINAREGQYIWGFHYIEALFGPLDVQPLASQIYGLYTFLVYCTPLLGGWLADKYIGQKRSVVIGGVLMTIGHFLMAFESLFLLALIFLIFGNGSFKPNISTQVGSLYPDGDPRKDSAFTIFYMGINLGAILSPLICGTLGEVYGWHYGFTAAGVGMVIGLVIYLWGQKYLVEGEQARLKLVNDNIKEKLTPKQWKAIAGFFVLSLANIIFWGIFEQQGNTLQLLSTDHTDWSVGSITFPSTWLQMLNPLFIFMFAPVLMGIWQRQGTRQLSSIAKMSVGCFLLGIGFIFLIYVTRDFTEATRISFLWFVPCMFVVTIGELFFSPIGLSLVTKIAPPKIAGLMMGWWFFTTGLGNYFGGYLGTFYSQLTKTEFFTLLLILGLAVGTFIFVLQKPLKKAVGAGV